MVHLTGLLDERTYPSHGWRKGIIIYNIRVSRQQDILNKTPPLSAHVASEGEPTTAHLRRAQIAVEFPRKKDQGDHGPA